MRKPVVVLLLLGAFFAVGEGCAPIPLPHYAAYRPRRVEELLVDSEKPPPGGRRVGTVLVPRPAVAHDPVPDPWRPRPLIRPGPGPAGSPRLTA